MLKVLFILIIGIAIGYGYGFQDARRHDKNVVERVVGRVGGSNRGKYKADLDAAASNVDR